MYAFGDVGYLIQGSGVGNQYKVMRMITKMNKKKMMILSLSFHLILGSLFALRFFNTNRLHCNSAVSSYS